MKPLNLDNRPCSPISSNCVIWQGPDIACIKLCAGDTVSDVVFALATELCTIIDTLDVNNYDLSCFNSVACPPANFQELIQFLIERICEAQGITITNRTTSTSTSTCPDCVVSVASCFIEGTQTTMQLVDYVQMIANRICSLITQIIDLQNQINNLDIRVNVLETTPPPTFTLPSLLVDCTLQNSPFIGFGSTATQINTLLGVLINDNDYGYCALRSATGLPSDIVDAVDSQCILSATDSLAFPGVPMGTVYSGTWVNTPLTIADSLIDLWISLCDIRTSLYGASVVVEGSTWIDVTPVTIGNATTYTVSEIEKPGLSVYLAPPADLLKIAPGLNTGRLCDGQIQIMTGVDYDDFLTAYDDTTGLFTVPETGVYTISFFVSYTNNATTGWYNAATPGMIIAGITSPVTCDFLCVNNYTPVVTQKYASINGSMTRELIKDRQICLRVINLTSYDYTSTSGDVVRMSIQRVK
jgi:hypothetical protein